MNANCPPSPPRPPRPPRSELASDRAPLLKPWSAKDEAELRDAQRRIDEATARRERAVQRVADLVLGIGAHDPDSVTDLAERLVANAAAIRDVLAPFDDGTRAPEVCR